MIEVISGTVYLYGYNTGESSYYDGYYGMNTLHMKYSMKMETARDYDKELYKQTGAINSYLYTDSDFGTIGDKLASGVAIS